MRVEWSGDSKTGGVGRVWTPISRCTQTEETRQGQKSKQFQKDVNYEFCSYIVGCSEASERLSITEMCDFLGVGAGENFDDIEKWAFL